MSKFTTLGVELIAQERVRQISEEGWDVGHDLEHEDNALSIAAACYAVNKTDVDGRHIRVVRYCLKPRDPEDMAYRSIFPPDAWPFDSDWDKRKKHSRLRSLVIAGALIAAEIDRLMRVEETP